MKTETDFKWKVIKSSSPERLDELADKLKDRDLFPEQVKAARKLLQNARFIDRATELRWRRR